MQASQGTNPTLQTVQEDRVRKALCTHLGRQVLASTGIVSHSKWEHRLVSSGHASPLTPPTTPELPYGSLWSLVNHIKVMHQYTELLSEAAAGKGPHSPLLSGSGEMCVGPFDWFLPLCQSLCRAAMSEDTEEYQ